MDIAEEAKILSLSVNPYSLTVHINLLQIKGAEYKLKLCLVSIFIAPKYTVVAALFRDFKITESGFYTLTNATITACNLTVQGAKPLENQTALENPC